MKKFVLILFLLLLTTSCNKFITKNVYERNYSYEKTQTAILDVYSQMHNYDLDSIPMPDWITNIMTVDTITIDQRTARKILNENSSYTFIFTKYTYPSKSYYNFKIRYAGKEKDLK